MFYIVFDCKGTLSMSKVFTPKWGILINVELRIWSFNDTNLQAYVYSNFFCDFRGSVLSLMHQRGKLCLNYCLKRRIHNNADNYSQTLNKWYWTASPQPRWRPVDCSDQDEDREGDSWKLDHWDSLATRDRNLISHHECLGEVSIARELGGSPHDVVHCVRDAGVAAILRD